MIKLLFLIITLQYPADTTVFNFPNDIFTSSEKLLGEGKVEEAIGLLNKISINDTSYIESQNRLMVAKNRIKDYTGSIGIGKKIKDKPSEFRPDIYINLGNAYLDHGSIDSAKLTYKEGLSLFPFQHVMMYNLGLAYYRNNELAEAIECFQKSAKINPFYASNHAMLGYISLLQGYRTKSLLSYLTYLAINPDNNQVLVLIDNLVSDATKQEGSVKGAKDNTIFEYYDNLSKSKAALDSRFRSKVEFSTNISRQVELLFSKLKYIQGTNDFWMDFYVPMYSSLEKNQLSQAFIYFILSSVKKEAVTQWLKEHEEEKTKWISIANSSLKEFRSKQAHEVKGQKDFYLFWYNSDNLLTAVGNQIDEDTRIGPWLFFHPNGQLSASGAYNQAGARIGDWKYYYTTGQLSQEENNNDFGAIVGQAKYYHKNGAKSIEANYKENKLNGYLIYFYECDEIKEKVPFISGLKDGNGKLFYETGQEKLDYQFVNEELDGAYNYYWKNGNVSNAYIYEKGMRQGQYTAYNIDGTISETGEYLNDEMNGSWKGFHANGKTSYEGSLENGLKVGNWSYSHSNGIISERTVYSDSAKSAVSKFFDRNGILLKEEEIKLDKLIALRVYNPSGSIVYQAQDSEGNFLYKDFFSNGKIKSEGNVENGKLHGALTTFHDNGMIYRKINLINGLNHGLYEEYFSTGGLYIQCHYDSGKLHGAYRQYYSNGRLNKTGLYANDKQEQLWTTFNPDSSLYDEQYYINGQLNGWNLFYAPSNKVQIGYHYEMGILNALRQYDSLGNIYHESDIKFGNGDLILKSTSGKIIKTSKTKCGEFVSDIKRYYPDGKIINQYTLKNALYDGPYFSNDPNGQVESHGNFLNDQKSGEWIWNHENGKIETKYEYLHDEINGKSISYYTNGQVESVCTYEEGDRVGPCIYYDRDGNLQLTKLYNQELGLYAFAEPGKDTVLFKREGDFTLESHYPDGKIAVVQEFLHGKYNGKSTKVDKSGKLSEVIHFQSGDYHGLWTVYHPNGKVMSETPYRYDLKHGTSKSYYENGVIKSVIPYVNDQINGWAIYYDARGVPSKKIFYWNGVPY